MSRSKVRLLALLSMLFWSGLQFSGMARADTFSNPVIPSDTADLFIRYDKGKYYLVCTHGDLDPNTGSKSLHTKLAIYSSDTLGGLKHTDPVVLQDMGEFLESPELWHFDDHWYVYCTTPHHVDGHGDVNNIHVLESAGDDPMGPYDQKGIIQTGAWDADILEMNNRRYLLSSPGGALWIQEMSSPTHLIGQPVKFAQLDQPWELHIPGAGFDFMEAPEAMHHNNDYFIFYTAGDYQTNGYLLGALRYQGGDPMAPSSWKKLPGPLFQGNGDRSRGAGDCTPFQAADNSWWFAYSSWENQPPGAVRSCRVQKMLDFDADGNPKFPPVNNPGVPMDEPEHQLQ